MPLVGGIVYGDKYPYVLPVCLWVAEIFLLAGIYAFSLRYHILCKLYGAVVFLFFFLLGGALVSLQLKQAEYTFPKTGEFSTCQVSLATKPEIKKNSILFRVALKGEAPGNTFSHKLSEKFFLFYFPKDSATCSLKEEIDCWSILICLHR